MPICGNCKANHASSAEVKACYGIQERQVVRHNAPMTNEAAAFQAQRQSAIATATKASDKQVAFLKALCAERPAWADVENLHDDVIERLTKQDASAKIAEALKQPKEVAKEQQPVGKVISACPDGYYAIPSATGNNDLDFYVVEHGKKGGKWEGYQFVSRVIGGRADQRIRGIEAAKAIQRIVEAGPEQAAQRYGQEIGQCGRCNRHLTDEVSRQLGIGPVCREQAW